LKKLVIFGVGLIGGSVALALKKAGALDNSVAHIVGVGRSEKSLNEALKLGVIDAICIPNEKQTNGPDHPLSKSLHEFDSSCIHAACSDADLILIAAPVAQTADILRSIKPHLNAKTVITDAGSTKSDVLATARDVLGDQFSQFVGGHPIAGAEKSGVAAAKSDLFLGKNVVLTPTNLQNIQDDAPEANIHAASRASNIARVTEMWQACGAKVSEMSAETHDSIFAAVSHLPHLLAFALVDDIASRPNAEQLFSFAASGFRDFTRIAGSHPEMWRDISLANKTALLSEISAFENELIQLKELLKNEDGAGLQALFERASVARNNWAESKK
jgi:prephenate dehydrogenase